MALDEVNQRLGSLGGRWVKLRVKTDGILDGDIVDGEYRVKTFEGAVVRNRKTGEERQELILTLQTDRHDEDGDDGLRKFAADESAQRAISEALREAGAKLAAGGHLRIGVVTDPETTTAQAAYKARYTAPAPAIAQPPAVDDDPAGLI